jgi:hypothetical protein
MRSLSTYDHLVKAVSWLRYAASISKDCGFAHSYHILRGWAPSYPETTGYIIPTLKTVNQYYSELDLTCAIDLAWRWLVSIQSSEGYFADLSGKPQVFDTGQILIGACSQIASGVMSSPEVTHSACNWLISNQSMDGSFSNFSYNNIPHSYYSRVGAALIYAGKLLGEARYLDAGMKNIEWTIAQQKQGGWFAAMSFDNRAPFSHTVVYTLEGLLSAYLLTYNQQILDSLLLAANSLLGSIQAHGGVIRSQYAETFIPVNSSVCITGLCQWSALCSRLSSLGYQQFTNEARRSLDFAKRSQITSRFKQINGALPGSVPFYSRYMRLSFPNWGTKFFIDALLANDQRALPPLL